MGKLKNLGCSTSSDEIPQPISILLGKNLRKNSDQGLEEAEAKIEKTAPYTSAIASI